MRDRGVIRRALFAVGGARSRRSRSPPRPRRRQTLSRAARPRAHVAGVSRAQTGAFAFDLRPGRVVYGLHRRAGRSSPASNEKLGVALAALERLGPGYRIRTAGPRRRDAGTRPTWRAGSSSRASATRRSRRRDLRTPRVARSRAAGIAPRHRPHRRGRELLRQAPHGERLEALLLQDRVAAALGARRRPGEGERPHGRQPGARGGQGASGRRSRRRRDRGRRQGGRRPRRPAARRRSRPSAPAPLRRIVRRMNKISDNFYAEMLVKHLGAEVRGEGTTPAGCIVVRRGARGARACPLAGVRIVDGSGLSLATTARPRARVGALLVSAWGDPAVRHAVLRLARRSPAWTGRSRTACGRARPAAACARRRARLSTASALSGYVGTRYVFAILQNGQPDLVVERAALAGPLRAGARPRL